MSAIDRLIANYDRLVRLSWPANVSGKQRVWFAVYPPAEERRLRAHLPQFETNTLEAKHGWTTVDLTLLLPEFVSAHEYREGIFQDPGYFTAKIELEAVAAERVRQACSREEAAPDSIVAVLGLASLFDFIHVSGLIDRVEDCVRGRLLVFFPGEYQRNIYRFMDARDGFNYMAVPITSTETFLNP
jgi:hypothetical protein